MIYIRTYRTSSYWHRIFLSSSKAPLDWRMASEWCMHSRAEGQGKHEECLALDRSHWIELSGSAKFAVQMYHGVDKITSKRAILGMLWRCWTVPVCHTESYEHPSGLQERTGHDLSNFHLIYSRNISWRTGLPISRSFLLRVILSEKQIDRVKQKYDTYHQHGAPRAM